MKGAKCHYVRFQLDAKARSVLGRLAPGTERLHPRREAISDRDGLDDLGKGNEREGREWVPERKARRLDTNVHTLQPQEQILRGRKSLLGLQSLVQFVAGGLVQKQAEPDTEEIPVTRIVLDPGQLCYNIVNSKWTNLHEGDNTDR